MKTLQKPEKPSATSLKLYDGFQTIVSVSINKELTAESESEYNNEYNNWNWIKYLTIVSSDGPETVISSGEFENFYEFNPGLEHVWVMKTKFVSKCSKWVKYIDSEKEDFELYLQLREKFK